MKILILDGGNANTLAITRHLGEHKDLELHVVGYNKLAQACYSKYVSKKFLFPSPKKNKEFYAALITQLKKEKYDLLMQDKGIERVKLDIQMLQIQMEMKKMDTKTVSNNNQATKLENEVIIIEEEIKKKNKYTKNKTEAKDIIKL